MWEATGGKKTGEDFADRIKDLFLFIYALDRCSWMQQEKNTEQDAKRQKSCSHSRGVAGLAKTSTLFIAYTHNFFFFFSFS